MQIISLIYTYILSLYLFFYNENLLQKQYYELKRFISIKKQFFKINILKIILFILSFILSFITFKNIFFNLFLKIGLLISYYFLYKVKRKEEIIKFKFTNRVKRALLSYSLVFSLYILIVFLLDFKYDMIPLLYLIVFSLFFLLSYFLSLLFEKIILKKFQIKAKLKLKKMKNLKIIGISGSYGKTSLKNYIKQLLEGNYKVLASQKSYNTMQGLLKTINEDLKPYHEILILEMGVDRVKGMDKFIKFFPLDIGIITCIGKQHLATFKSFENIKNEKLKLLESLDSSKCAIINLDDFNIKEALPHLNCKCICISSMQYCDIYAENIKVKFNCTHFSLSLNNNQYCVKTSVLGRHHVNNILLAIATAKILNVEDNQILKRIRMLKNVEHRLSLKKDYLWDIIDDAYNSNVSGFAEALQVLKKSPNIKVLLTPGLIEISKEQDSINKQIARKIKDSVDYVFFTNLNGEKLAKELDNLHFPKNNMEIFVSFKDAYQYLKNNFLDVKLTILIENDLPDIFLK